MAAKSKTPSRQTSKPVKITFELLAPRNANVSLCGNWDGWIPHKMRKNKAGWWRVSIPLSDGEYDYKFKLISNSAAIVGQEVEIPDPVAIQSGKITYETSRVKIDQGKRVVTTYKWKHDNSYLAPDNQLVIYEMHLGDFRSGPGDNQNELGTFKTAIPKLDYLASLGINAIELMPVNEIPEGNHWGYSHNSLYAVENRYGAPDEFCEFVDACHARGIRVILDAVYNHTDGNAILTKLDYDYWFYAQNPDKEGLQFGPKYNFEFYDSEYNIWPARDYILGAIHKWVETFHIDGIRLDSTQAIKFFDVMKMFHQAGVKAAGDRAFVTIAEHIPEDPAIVGEQGPLNLAWQDNYRHQLIATTLGIEYEDAKPFDTTNILRVMNPQNFGYYAQQVVQFINNHDHERTMFLLGAKAHIFDDMAFRRDKLGATLLLTSPGIPMIYMGEEFGQPTSKSEGPQPLWWSLLNNERNLGLFYHYRRLIQFRKSTPAIYRGDFAPLVHSGDKGIIAYKRWDADGNIVVVVANLKDQHGGQFTIDGVEHGSWSEVFAGHELESVDGQLTDRLTACEAKIYIRH